MQQTLEGFNQKTDLKPTFTVEDFHVKVSVLLESEEALKIQEALYSLKSCDWLKYESLNICSLKMSEDYFPMMEDKLSELSSQLWGNVGMMLSGKFLTAKITSLKTEREYSLSDILEGQVDQKYFLSSTATERLLSYKDNKTSPIALKQDMKPEQSERMLLNVNSMHKTNP